MPAGLSTANQRCGVGKHLAETDLVHQRLADVLLPKPDIESRPVAQKNVDGR